MTMLALLMLAAAGDSAGGGGSLDTQTVTTGGSGTGPAQNRKRGFSTGAVIGSISDGTSDIYSGAAVTEFYWNENTGSPQYFLAITGAANSGWTQVVIDGTLTLTRASATYSSGTWTWTTADTVSTQVFGTISTNHTCIFS